MKVVSTLCVELELLAKLSEDATFIEELEAIAIDLAVDERVFDRVYRRMI